MSGAIYFQRVSNLAPSAAQFQEIDMLGVHFQYSCCLAVVRSSFAYGRSCLVDSGCRSTMKMHGCAQSTSSAYWFISKTRSFPPHMHTQKQTPTWHAPVLSISPVPEDNVMATAEGQIFHPISFANITPWLLWHYIKSDILQCL